VTYANFFTIYQVSIYETNGAGFVSRVDAYSAPDGTSTTIWEGVDSTTCGSALTVKINGGVVSNRLRIHTAYAGYEQIDAVQLCGVIVPSPLSAPPPPPHPPIAPPPCDAQIDIVLVVDNSGSVGRERPIILEFAKAIVSKFVMSPTAAQIGYVEFETTVTTLSGLTPSLSNITTVIDNAGPVGSDTYLSGGIATGQTVVTGAGARAGVPKVRRFCDPSRRHLTLFLHTLTVDSSDIAC
jgi:hypothetical protein